MAALEGPEKRALAPLPSALPMEAEPASVVTTAPGATFRMVPLAVSAT